jgi:hypothetical protein
VEDEIADWDWELLGSHTGCSLRSSAEGKRRIRGFKNRTDGTQ